MSQPPPRPEVHILQVAVSICLAFAVLVGISQLLMRRRRRYIGDMIAARGGRVVSSKLVIHPSAGWLVQYIGPQGDLREGRVKRRGLPMLCDDRPFQLVLREQYEREKSSDMLRKLKLAVELSRLPGSEAYKVIVRELAAGSAASVSIGESSSDAGATRRFAPVLQYVEAASISSDASDRKILRLVADGKKIDVGWSVEGKKPNRTLVMTAIR